MRFDLLARLRKWHLLGVLSVIFVSIACASTTVHALQHVASATSSTINPGDTEACGLCQVDFVTLGASGLTANITCSANVMHTSDEGCVLTCPKVSYFADTLRGPPADA